MNRRGFVRAGLIGVGAAAAVGGSSAVSTRALSAPMGQAEARGARPYGEDGTFRSEVVWQVPGPEPSVCLTFDDGPDPAWTPKVLDLLAGYHVPATFFLLGRRVAEHPALARRVRDAGHEIGNHTWDHPNLMRTEAPAVREQIEFTQRRIQEELGVSPRLVRPPYGHIDPPGLLAAARVRADVVLWSAAMRHTHAEADADSTLRDIRPGGIVLLHDATENCSQSLLDACGRVIETLRRRGWSFRTVGDALAAARA